MKKRILSMLLVVVMLVSLFPASVFHAHADTVTKKPFYLVNTSTPTGTSITNSYLMPKTYTGSTSGEYPFVYFMGQSDPAASAQALWKEFKDRPDGTRYFEFDVIANAVKNRAENRVYFDEVVTIVKAWLNDFLKAYSAIEGSKLDGIITDIEYHGSHAYSGYLGAYYEANKATFDVVKNIVADDSYPALRERLAELGFVFGSDKATEIATAFNWYPDVSQNNTSYKVWNQVMDEMERDAINEAVLYPLLKYFPDATVSDYQAAAQRGYNETLVWNGKPESYNNIYPAGNATNMNAYSGRFDGNHETPDGYILNAGETKIASTAFNSALFEVKFAKDALVVAKKYYGIDKQHIWVGGYSYGRMERYKDDDTGVLAGRVYTGAYSETPYYTEAMLHLGLATEDAFLGYIVENEETKKEQQYGGVGYQACVEIFDDILKELTKVAGYSDRKPIETAANWNGSYILSGMYAGGRNIWRLTPDISKLANLAAFNVTADGDPTFAIDGLTITFPGGRIIADGAIRGYQGEGAEREKITNNSCGYWIETGANVKPVITGTAGRYTGKTLTSETAAKKVLAAGDIYHNITMYNTVNGLAVTTSNADTDYRIVWVNNSANGKKAVVKNNGVEIATFAAPAGQDGVFTGTVHSHDSNAVNLTVEYAAPDAAGNTSGDKLGENYADNYVKNQSASVTVAGTEIAFAAEDNAKYYIVVNNALSATEDTVNYNVMADFVDGVPTLYLKGANLTATGDASVLKIGKTGCQNFDLNIVVEAESTLTSASGATIDANGLVGTVAFIGNAQLNVASTDSNVIVSTATLVMKDVKLNITASKNTADIYNNAAVWVKGANIVIDGADVTVTAASGACLWIGEINGTSGKYSINIKNKARVIATSSNTDKSAIACGGKIYIDDAYVSVNSGAAKYFASTEPVTSNVHVHAATNNTVVITNNLETTAGKDATCTAEGYTESVTCLDCGTVIKAKETVAAAGHKTAVRYDYVSATERKKVTYCLKCDAVVSEETVTVSATEVKVHFYAYDTQTAHQEYGVGSYVTLTEGCNDIYRVTIPASEGSINYVLTGTGASATNYNVKFSWPVGGTPTIYLKNAYYRNIGSANSGGAPFLINAGEQPVDIVVEADSEISSDYLGKLGSYNGLVSNGTGMLTIRSVGGKDGAKLKVYSDQNTAIISYGGLTLKDANVELKANLTAQVNNAAIIAGSSTETANDIIIDNSTLLMLNGAVAYFKNTKNLKIVNDSVVDLQHFRGASNFKYTFIDVVDGGEILISASKVRFYSKPANTSIHTASDFMFGVAPTLVGVTAKAGGWSGKVTGSDLDVYYEEANLSTFADTYDASRLNNYTYFETDPCKHTNVSVAATCYNRAVCADCGLAFGDTLPHTHAPITDCEVEVRCTVKECNAIVHAAGGHEWVVDAAVPATCEEDGLTEGKHCSACGEVETYQEVIPATGHTEVVKPAKAPNCTEPGNTLGIVCSVCDAVIEEYKVLDPQCTEVIDPAVAATCTTKGLTQGSHCSVCDRVIKLQTEIPALGHKTVDTKEYLEEATCTSEAKYILISTCTVCKEETGRTSAETPFTEPTLPHKLTHSVKTVVEDEEEVKYNIFTCSECGHVEDSMTYDYIDYGEKSAYLQFYDANEVVKYRYFTTNAPYYLRTVNGFVTDVDAEEYNYNIKAVFADGKLTIYLRDAEIYDELRRPPVVIGGGYTEETGLVYNFSVDIIVESDSAITVAGSKKGSNSSNAIYNAATGLLTISSVNNAKLTLSSIAANGDTATGVTLCSVGGVKLLNANVEISNVYQVEAVGIGGANVNSNLEVVNSKFTVTTNNRSASNAIRLSSPAGNVTFTNSQIAIKMLNHGQYTPAIYMLGEFAINCSDVEIYVNCDPFHKTPTIDANTTAKWGQYSSSAANTAYTLEAGRLLNEVYTGFMGHFKTTHTCLEGTPVQIAPEHPCDDKMIDVFSCVVCGKQMRTAESSVDNEAKADHVDGEPVRKNNDDGTYCMVTYCTVCGDATHTGDPVTLMNAWISFEYEGLDETYANDGVEYYYLIVDGKVTTTGATAQNYNIKVVYPDDGNNKLFVYLNGGTLTNDNSNHDYGLMIGGDTVNDFACEIIVESDTTISAYGACIVANCTDLTIRSDEGAKLTLKNRNAAFTLSTTCDVSLQNANVEFVAGYYNNIQIAGDLEIVDSNVKLTNSTGGTTYAIVLSTKASSLDGTTNGNISIRNSNVTSTMISTTYTPAWLFEGRFDIERSDVEIRSNAKAFSNNPYIAEGTHTSVKVAAYATAGATGALSNYTATEGAANSGLGYIKTTHVHGGGTVEYVEPAIACSAYMDKVTHCAVPGCEEIIRETSTDKVNETPAKHTHGNAVIEKNIPATESTAGSYDEVVYCTECNAEISRNTVVVPAVKKATVKFGSTTITLVNDGNPVYYTVSASGALTKLIDDTSGYNLKLVYNDAENKVYIYLNGVNTTKSNTGALIIGSSSDSSVNGFACEIVVEQNSVITAQFSGATNAAIYAYNTAGLKITSENNKQLTVNPSNYGVAIKSMSATVIDGVTLIAHEGYDAFSAIYVKGNFTIQNSSVTLDATTNYPNHHLWSAAILLSDSANSVTGESYDLRIVNSKLDGVSSTNAVFVNKASLGALSFTGSLYIDRSDVNIDGNMYAFTKTPTLTGIKTSTRGEYGPGSTAYSSYAYKEPNTPVAGKGSAYYIGGFTTVHECGGGKVEYVAPAIPCSAYMDKVTHCAVYGCEVTIRETSTEVENPTPAEHTYGEAEKVLVPELSNEEYSIYQLVKTCTYCGATAVEEETIKEFATKNAYVAIAGTSVENLKNDGVAHYYTVSGFTATETNDTVNYNVKVVFPNAVNGEANDTVYIYLNNLTVTYASNGKSAIEIGSTSVGNFACEVVIESNSSITCPGGSGSFGGILAQITGGLTIRSKGNATLTMNSVNAGTLRSTLCDLTLVDANLICEAAYYSNINVNGNLLVENSNLTLTALGGGLEFQILLHSAYSSKSTSDYDLTIRNSVVTSTHKNAKNTPIWSFAGKFVVDRCDISLKANKVPFQMTPTITNATAKYGQYTGNTASNVYAYEPDQLFTSVHTTLGGYMGEFVMTHVHGGGEVEYVAPAIACSAYMDKLTHCAVHGCEYALRETSTQPNETPAEHTYGEAVKEYLPDQATDEYSVYKLVKTCTACGATDDDGGKTYKSYASKNAYVSFGGQTNGSTGLYAINLTNDGTEYCYTVSGYTLTAVDPTAEYNIKVVFPNAVAGKENNTVFIYLNNLTYDSRNMSGYDFGLRIGSDTVNDFACEIIVESASSITADGASENYAPIYAVNTGGLTITSKNQSATLTLYGANAGALRTTACGLNLINANVISKSNYYGNICVNGDLNIENSTLTLNNASYTYAVLLSSVYNKLDGTSTSDITIKNSVVKSNMPEGKTPNLMWAFGGDFTIDRSDVDIRSNSSSMFSKNPTLVNATATYNSHATSASGVPNTVYGESMYGTTGKVGHLVSVHTCGGVKEHAATIELPCAYVEVYRETCAVYGCTQGYEKDDFVYSYEGMGDHDLYVADRVVVDPTTTAPGSETITYKCSVCSDFTGYEKVVTNELPMLKGVTFKWYNSASKDIYPAEVIQGNAEQYFVMEGNYLTATGADANNYDVKLVYPTGGVPTIYLNGLTLSNDYGIRYESADNSPVKVIVESESTIDRATTEGNYQTYPALYFATTGDVTISGAAKLNLKSARQYEEKAVIYSMGNLILDHANVEITGSNSNSQPTGIVVDGGDLIIKGGNLLIADVTAIGKQIKVTKNANGEGGNMIIKENAVVTTTKVESDSQYAAFKPLIDTEGVVRIYSGCTVSFAGWARLFSNIPEYVGYSVHTNVTEDNLASTQSFSAVPGECPHTNKTHTPAVEPNCARDGNIEYWQCDVCDAYLDAEGNILKDAEGNAFDEDDLIVKKDANSKHVAGEKWIKLPNTVDTPIKPATCGQDGYYYVGNVCAGCDEVIVATKKVDVPMSSAGHAWVNTSVVDATTSAMGTITQECSACHETRTINTPALFYGTNVDLGNSLEINFYFYSKLKVEYGYAEIVRTYANGQTTSEKVALDTVSGTYYVISYNAIAAKEMCDEVTVTVYDADGNAISQPRTESVKGYAMRLLSKEKYYTNAKLRTLLVDMLNYGAAMQEHFNYNNDPLKLANADLTAEQRAWATTSVTMTNGREVDTNVYKASSVTTKSNISLNIYADANKIGENGRIVVSYIDFTGKAVNAEITAYTQKGAYYIFALNTLRVADSRAELNITFYNAAGNAIGTVVESMAYYMARNGEAYADATMKFTDAASAYFAK